MRKSHPSEVSGTQIMAATDVTQPTLHKSWVFESVKYEIIQNQISCTRAKTQRGAVNQFLRTNYTQIRDCIASNLPNHSKLETAQPYTYRITGTSERNVLERSCTVVS